MNNNWTERIAEGWHRLWFTPEPARNLAAARIIFAAHALWVLMSRDLPAISALPPEFWAFVPRTALWRYLIFPGHSRTEEFLQGLAVVALLGALTGFYPRLSCLVSGLLLYHLAPLETIIWTTNPYIRGFTITVLGLVTLSVSPCGDAFCLFGRRQVGSQTNSSWVYGWPLRLIQVFLCQVYLFSAYVKLSKSGLAWVTAENIHNWLLYISQVDQVSVYKSLGLWIADHPAICLLVAIGTIALELGFMAVIFWKGSRVWLIPLAALFHVGILFSMNLTFLNLPQLLIFVDWGALSIRLKLAQPAHI